MEDYRAVNPLFTISAYGKRMNWSDIEHCAGRMVATAVNLLIVALCLAFAQPALAQTTTTYVNTTNGTISAATPCTSPLVRTFVVGDTFTVADVDLGVFITHTWRGDSRITLTSPDGTSVQLVDGDANSTSGDNFNVLLDDAATQTVNTDSATGAHSTAAPPPFDNTFSPNSPLSAFNGESSNGTWTLEICDIFTGADNGTFQHAELYLTSLPANFADLSLTKVNVGSPAVQGGTATWRLTLTNNSLSTLTATNIIVEDTFPSGFTFASATGDGSFDSINSEWSIGSLAPGTSVTLTVSGTVSATAGTTLTNTAEITASDQTDSDSTPNNGVTSEDDYAFASFTVQTGRSPGTPPVLSCPAFQSTFDWDTISGWTAGSLDNTYAFSTFGNIRFQITNDGAFVNSGGFGGQSPTVVDTFEGGLSPAEDSLTLLANQANQSGEAEVTITLPRTFTGLQFTIFDVDFGNNQFADRVEVVGTNDGATVNPTLTNGNVNYVSGGEVIGDGASGSGDALGNMVVTFTDTVDTVIIRYGNHTTAPANPGQQGIGVHDITVCDPVASLSITKTSSIISDGFNSAANSKAIPGALIEYLITVTNDGPDAVDADTIELIDDGPAEAKFCLVTQSGGPVTFAEPLGTGSTGLTYTFSGYASTTDSLDFWDTTDNDWEYEPQDDGEACDPAVTEFRITPDGAMEPNTNFTVRVRYRIE